MNRNQKIVLSLFIWLMGSTAVLTFFVWDNSLQRAAITMIWSLIFFWVAVCGTLIYLLKDKFNKFYSRINWLFWIKFTIFATIFALIEELVAVSINNYFLPVTKGQVQLTASTNYWEVISQHSVVVLIPIFIIFGFLVQKFQWSPFKTFLIFGLVGTLAETTVSGLFGLLSFGLWIFVYGLMVYLPAHRNVGYSNPGIIPIYKA